MRNKKLFCPLIISLAALSFCESALAEKSVLKANNDAPKSAIPFYQNANIVTALRSTMINTNQNNNITIIVNGVLLNNNLQLTVIDKGAKA